MEETPKKTSRMATKIPLLDNVHILLGLFTGWHPLVLKEEIVSFC